jgi:hypothetical protein
MTLRREGPASSAAEVMLYIPLINVFRNALEYTQYSL